jgi:hypothetical protein
MAMTFSKIMRMLSCGVDGPHTRRPITSALVKASCATVRAFVTAADRLSAAVRAAALRRLPIDRPFLHG